MQILSTRTFLLVLLLLVAAGAQQKTLDGQWSSDSGATVSIATTTGGLSITVYGADGSVGRWQGRWLRQWNLFDYQANGASYTGQVSNSNTIVVNGSGGSQNVWYRQQGSLPNNASSYASFAQGRWYSSSGNTVDVQTQSGNVYVTVYGKQGEQWQGQGAWVDGSSFRYSVTGWQGDFIGTVLSDGRVKIIYTGDGKVTYWSRG
jgi:hypothetical protein